MLVVDSTIQTEQPNEIEVTLKEFDELVELKKAFDRLLVNPDFKLVIEQEYLEKDGHRLYELLLSDNVSLSRDRAPVLEKIVSKGWLKNWIKATHQSLDGIDNPEHRAELVKQLNDMEGSVDE